MKVSQLGLQRAQAQAPADPMELVMDLARLRRIIADGRYAIDPVAVAEALLRAPDLAGMLAAGPPPAAP